MDDPKAPASSARAKTSAAVKRKGKPDTREGSQTDPPNEGTEEKSNGRAKSLGRRDVTALATNQNNGRKAKVAEPSLKETTEPQLQMLKDATKAPSTTARAKPQCAKAKLAEENHEVKQQKKNDRGKIPMKNAEAKAASEKPILPDAAETTAEDQPSETSKKTTKKSADKTKSQKSTEELITIDESKVTEFEEKKAGDAVLKKTLQKLKMNKPEISSTSTVVNEVKEKIVKHLKQTNDFKDVGDPLNTGSYYENLKISNPDEFDVMIVMPVDRAKVEPFGDDGAFYSVGLKRTSSPLMKFQEDEKLSASKMLDEFRDEVKKCVEPLKEWKVTRKKPGCPAVTMTTEVNSVPISLDVVLSVEVKSSWPAFTNDGLQIDRWLSAKRRAEYRRKPFYLVPKYEGRGTVQKDGVLAKDAWRVSFSHIEKDIIRNHGSEKTCCEQVGKKCCRKECLKLLKKLLSLLKESDPSFDKFYSYLAKTTLLHACCSRTKDAQWAISDLSCCFQQLLEDFEGHLESGELKNFFIPTQNLLSGFPKKKCQSLAARLREERTGGFPLFKNDLSNSNLS